MKQYRFVLNITREPGNHEHGAGVVATYDSAAPAVSIQGTPYPGELKLIQKLLEVCEGEVRGQPVRIVRGQE